MKIYIAYGSNLNIENMSYRCPKAKLIGAFTLKDYALMFCGSHECAVATIKPRKDRTVPCLLWEITPSDEAALDRYEGFPILYHKETVRIPLDKKAVDAMIYIMNDGYPPASPSCYYYSLIFEGYKSAGFDVSILKQAVTDSMEMEDANNG